MKTGHRSTSEAEIAERLRKERRILVVTHEAPDGDALGCVSAMLLVCECLNLTCSAYIPGDAPFPREYGFLPRLERVLRGSPPRVGPDTTLYFLDCASPLRADSNGFSGEGLRVNIDHHQDNPGYGELNLVDAAAPSTTVLLHRIFAAGGYAVDAGTATALYVGLVTDTGRFQYSNTSPEAHRVAAELQVAGCDVHEVYRRVYESVPVPKMLLTQRMLAHMELRLGGALVTSWLSSDDLAECGADEGHTEGLIDTLRCVDGAMVAAVARERLRDGHPETKVSLRSTTGTIDVADIAHEEGGGGHTRAAGLTSDKPVAAVLEWIERSVRARL
jgi:phosphoesterase RecJ-like protein